MFNDLSDEQLEKEYSRLTKLKNECETSLRDIANETRKRKNRKPEPAPVKEIPIERQQGAVWQVEEKGRSQGWWGMSSEGASGPWNNKQAAEAASRDMFKTAGQHNARNYTS
jgi:hypothetical protein